MIQNTFSILLFGCLTAVSLKLSAAEVCPTNSPSDELTKITERMDPWETSLESAKKRAQAEKKDLFILFTGSDWCPPCQKLEAEFFKSKEFLDNRELKEGFVFLKLDFLRKTKLSKERTKEIYNLAEEFHVNSFPTMLLASAGGETYGKLSGYDPRLKPGDYATQIADLKNQKEKR